MAMNAAINPACSIQMKYTAVFPAMRYILQTKKREQVGRIFLLVSRASLTEMLYTIPCSSDFFNSVWYSAVFCLLFQFTTTPFLYAIPGGPPREDSAAARFSGKNTGQIQT